MKKMRLSRQASMGFTIVELLIVVVVIAILAAITIVAYNGISERSRNAAADNAVTQAAKKIMTHITENSEVPPITLSDAGIMNSGGVTYQYTRNVAVSPGTFCITATVGTISSHVAMNGKLVDGPCVGHTGTARKAANLSCPAGYIPVPGSSLFGTSEFCVMKFEAKNVGGVATSQAAGAPWVYISQNSAITTATAACSGCHLITEAEWLTLAHNILSVPSNWSGGAVGSGYVFSGHNDNNPANSLAGSTDNDGYNGTGNSSGNQRRTLTLTNGEVIWDVSGNAYEWTQGTVAAGKQPGFLADATLTWKNWNDPGLLMNGVSPMAMAAYGTPEAATWTSSQGIGQLYSNYNDASTRGFLRGGVWYNGATVGVTTLQLGRTPTYSNDYVGFRVAK